MNKDDLLMEISNLKINIDWRKKLFNGETTDYILYGMQMKLSILEYLLEEYYS